MYSRDEILKILTSYLEELFEIPAEKIVPEASLYEQLGLDSIDAVDLVVKLQELTGKRIRPENFKNVRTVGDIVDCVEALLSQDVPAI